MLSLADIRPLHLADVSAPQGHPRAGETVSVYGFVVTHPQGIVVIDTGVGAGNPAIEQLYRPVQRPLSDALADLLIQPSDIAIVINTHLHFDHCGENRLFPGRPIFVQAKEYEAAHSPLYTILDWVDFPEAKFELLDGQAEILPGLSVVSTPGHTPGHQSVLLESNDGRVIIAGQAAETAAEFARVQPGHEGDLSTEGGEEHLASLRRLHELAPCQVHFSHDATVWQPETSP